MKKLLLAALLILMSGSCRKPTVVKQPTHIVTQSGENPIDLVVIEGCEYLEYSYGRKYSLCHKGNCKRDKF